jgi:hypothetical protein
VADLTLLLVEAADLVGGHPGVSTARILLLRRDAGVEDDQCEEEGAERESSLKAMSGPISL